MSDERKNNRHHYISQFYLKPFADKEGADKYIVQVLDKTTGKIYPSNVGKVAFQHQFNRLEKFSDSPNELEDWLADVEGSISTQIKQIINSKELNDETEAAVVNLMTLFACRRPKGRDQIQSETNKVEHHLFSALYHDPSLSANRTDGVTHEMIRQALDEGQGTYTQYDRDQFIQTEFVLVRDTFRDLSKRRWHLLDSSATKVRFITSDNPVGLFVPNEGFYALNFSGKLNHPDSLVYFPLTPELAFYGVLSDEAPPEMTDRFAAELNTYIVNYLDERIFYNSDGFLVIDNDGEISTQDDVQRVFKEWLDEDENGEGE